MFINYASDILGSTSEGLSGSKIAEYCAAYAIDFNVEIPHPFYPFLTLPNKRTALRENLYAFNSTQQFQIIKELSELQQFKGNNNVKELKIRLVTRYSALSISLETSINQTLIEETIHWLADFQESLELFNSALLKLQNKVFERNLLDDLRLSLELLLKGILNNNKSMEKQISDIGVFLQKRNGSKEFTNMFLRLVDYYSKYQNSYVKHNDAVIESEIEFIYEMTCSFMKLIVRVR